MKKFFLVFLMGSLIAVSYQCGSGSGDDKKEQTDLDAQDITKHPDYQRGLELIAKSDCLTCHKIDEKVNGPSYREVANKYAGMPDTIIGYLAHKIIAGGSGTWGTIFMTPHPNLSQEDAESMVKYILLLKK
jgi:cytochrome c